jgi:hypothetical protein
LSDVSKNPDLSTEYPPKLPDPSWYGDQVSLRHQQIVADSEQELIDWIANKTINKTLVNNPELFHKRNERFKQKIRQGWVDSFVEPHAEKLFETTSVPQENQRLEVLRAFLETAIEGFRDYVHNSCAELGFNLDEIGMSEWEDGRERRVVVPSTMRWRKISHVIHGNSK